MLQSLCNARSVHKAKARDDIHKEEEPDGEQLVKGCPSEEIEEVHTLCVFETLLLKHVHESCWKLKMKKLTNSQDHLKKITHKSKHETERPEYLSKSRLL